MNYIIIINSRAYLTRLYPSMSWSEDKAQALRMSQALARSVAGKLIQAGKRACVIEVKQ